MQGRLQVAKIIREDFLAQNAYSPYDPCCPFYKSVWMLKNIILFYTLALKAVELSGTDRKISLAAIKNVSVPALLAWGGGRVCTPFG